MGTEITLAALATRTTTTRTETHVQPYEVDTHEAGAAVDLDEERAVSLRLSWQATQSSAQRCATLETVIESGDAAEGPWTPVSEQFDRVDYGGAGGGLQSIGFVSPGQFLRARWIVRANGAPTKLEARFVIAGGAR